ncbi:MAG: hypothetical protein KAI17_13665 [Thiotrichaceae bacterium]|nr:hypothetical protein [Thiotrichaceae bacterium]
MCHGISTSNRFNKTTADRIMHVLFQKIKKITFSIIR